MDTTQNPPYPRRVSDWWCRDDVKDDFGKRMDDIKGKGEESRREREEVRTHQLGEVKSLRSGSLGIWVDTLDILEHIQILICYFLLYYKNG